MSNDENNVKAVVYNKLVRDKIIDKIKNDPTTVSIGMEMIVDKQRLKPIVIDKLSEEINELVESYDSSGELDLEELADVLEVIDTIKRIFDVDPKLLGKIKDTKRKERGGFDKGIYLETVIQRVQE